ncbi:MAG: methyltransferase [Tannerellaceae bacterium]|jgi:tRNA1Val (adenine37-N6)-methyltransferase|nr:methyltransferase [Tannerellaceae bacterium]
MANDYFQFKQFNIQQDKCAMKVGTDGVLLGAWASVDSCHTILDIGTGTGLIALMLAQRSIAVIDALDIDKDAFVQASENVSSSPFANRIQVYHSSFAGFAASAKKKYDLVVSNPPYFVQSLKSPDNKKNLARHTDTLPLPDLLSGAKSLLAPNGRIAIILPVQREDELRDITTKNNLHIMKQTIVYPTPEARPKRLLVELSANAPASTVSNSFVIETTRHHYTPEYTTLAKDFYLKM